MQVHATLLAFAVILVVSIEAKPTWPVFVSGYHAPSIYNDVEPQLLQYQHSPLYVYNAVVNSVPATVLAEQKSPNHRVPLYSFYYGTPVYDVGYPLTPLYPPVKPGKPKELPKETTTTAKPTEENGESVEKLDTKVEPEKETKKLIETMENNEDDSITVDAI